MILQCHRGILVAPKSADPTTMMSITPAVMRSHRNNRKLLARVKAFDRHCNMILENVREMWTEVIAACCMEECSTGAWYSLQFELRGAHKIISRVVMHVVARVATQVPKTGKGKKGKQPVNKDRSAAATHSIRYCLSIWT